MVAVRASENMETSQLSAGLKIQATTTLWNTLRNKLMTDRSIIGIYVHGLKFMSLTCRSASRHRVSRDDSWVAETAEIQAVAVVIVLQKNRKELVID